MVLPTDVVETADGLEEVEHEVTTTNNIVTTDNFMNFCSHVLWPVIVCRCVRMVWTLTIFEIDHTKRQHFGGLLLISGGMTP